MSTVLQHQQEATQEFTLSQLSEEDQAFLHRKGERISTLLHHEAIDIVEIGKELAAARDRFKARGIKGEGFKAWLEHNGIFSMSRKQAYRYIQCYEVLGHCVNVDTNSFDSSALYLLCSPGCPQELRLEMVERARNGEYITHHEVKRCLDERKPKRKGLNPAEFIQNLQDNLTWWTQEKVRLQENMPDASIFPDEAVKYEKQVEYAEGRCRGAEFALNLFNYIRSGIAPGFIIDGDFDPAAIHIEDLPYKTKWSEFDIEISDNNEQGE